MDDWTELEQPVNHGAVPPAVDLQSMNFTETAASLFELLSLGAFRRLKVSNSPIFYVDLGVEPVYSTFLTHLPPDLQSLHMCSACQSFANRYGKLALVRDDGTLVSVLWSTKDLQRRDVQEVYGPSVKAVQQRFTGKKVFKDFNVENRPGFSRRKTLGTIAKDNFPHMYLQMPDSRIHHCDRTAAKAASVSEQAAMLDQLLTNASMQTIRKANWMLQNHKLPFARDHKLSCRWLLDLAEQEKIGRARGAIERHNLLYRHSADSFIASRKEARHGALNMLLENVQNNAPWPTLLAEWLWICGRAEFVRHSFISTKGKIRPVDFLLNRSGHRWEFPKHRLCVQDDVPENVVMWSPRRIGPQENHEGERPEKTEANEEDEDREYPPLTVGPPGAMVPCANYTKKLMRRKNTSWLVPNPSPRYGTTDVTLSDFITGILPKAKHVAYCHLPSDHIVTFITGIDDPKPIQEWDPRTDSNTVSAFVTLDAHVTEGTSRETEGFNWKAFHWVEVRCLIPFPDLWDDTAPAIKPPLTKAGTSKGSNSNHSQEQKRNRYLFVLRDIHAFDPSAMPYHEEVQVGNMKGGIDGDFVAGIPIDNAIIGNGPAPSFKVVSLEGHTKVYWIRDFE